LQPDTESALARFIIFRDNPGAWVLTFSSTWTKNNPNGNESQPAPNRVLIEATKALAI
jgi:hypothetical protein